VQRPAHYILRCTGIDAGHPAAARLFGHFVMTPEGNRIFHSEPDRNSVFDTNNLPKEHVSPKRGAPARREVITKLPGVTNERYQSVTVVDTQRGQAV
jgi:ABC-type Fe3+ transport system substrate-binding protein